MFRKADLYNGRLGNYTYLDNAGKGWFAQSSESLDNSLSDAFVAWPDSGNSIALYKITGAVGNERWVPVGSVGMPANVHSPWTVMSLIVRKGSIWTGGSMQASDSPCRADAQFCQIDPSGTLLQVGMVDDITGSNHYRFGTISVNQNNDVLAGLAFPSSATSPSPSV